uniref:Uncharacterized protein n=1 Tax=Cacopsylla melanoneura TaxID=428564 RepID=A0A8D9F5A2_9HEMI
MSWLVLANSALPLLIFSPHLLTYIFVVSIFMIFNVVVVVAKTFNLCWFFSNPKFSFNSFCSCCCDKVNLSSLLSQYMYFLKFPSVLPAPPSSLALLLACVQSRFS